MLSRILQKKVFFGTKTSINTNKLMMGKNIYVAGTVLCLASVVTEFLKREKN